MAKAHRRRRRFLRRRDPLFFGFIRRYPRVDVSEGVSNEQVSLLRREA